ncbi:putative rhamnosyl transferase [Paenibacillus glycanilyticus]|uniref:glycosyltransferase family A protein n=1 Tax=Paenibacillus glycanilyticus TaxID=126569 RepID=UPI00203CC701|nr:glycosyltransferase family A protein [Paenibacillus glycanilyticus]MCM3627905.1 putative rhamnosyl transferase [Paenibacillus glycanilyticus]
MTKAVVVEIEFNNRSNRGGVYRIGLTPQWIKYRMAIFMKYTLQSLLKQTNQNFHVFIRYTERTEGIVRAQLAKYPKLPVNIRFVADKKYEEKLRKTVGSNAYLYLVRLDCDDTYHHTFIDQLHKYKPKSSTRALINQAGYIYDSIRHRIATVSKSSPPFYTWIYKSEQYFGGLRYKTVDGHSGVIKHKHEVLTTAGKRNYMVVVHDRNTLNQRLLKRHTFIAKKTKVDAILSQYI